MGPRPTRRWKPWPRHWPAETTAFEILKGGAGPRLLDDPDIVPAESLRSIACISDDGTMPVEAPLQRRLLDGGDYAVLRHKGPYADMHKAYQWLFGEWLPQSGRQLRDSVMFEDYLNNPRDVPPTELLTEIHMPLV